MEPIETKSILRAEHWCLEGELAHREGPFFGR